MKRNSRLLAVALSLGVLLITAIMVRGQAENAPAKERVAFKWLAKGKYVYMASPTLDSRVTLEVLEGDREKKLLTPRPELGIGNVVYQITDVQDDFMVLKPMGARVAGNSKLREVVLPLASIAEVQIRDNVEKVDP